MLRIFLLLPALFFFTLSQAQRICIGETCIQYEDFIQNYRYGLEHQGAEKTLQNWKEFALLQEFAKKKGVDSLTYFGIRMAKKEKQLLENHFYPEAVFSSIKETYLKARQKEYKLRIFLGTVDKKHNYESIYQQILRGELTMDAAITRYTGKNPQPAFFRMGTMDPSLEKYITHLRPGELSPLIRTQENVIFVQMISSRPSPGHLIFGRISWEDTPDGRKKGEEIQKRLATGESFEKVAKELGSDAIERERAGLEIDSPALSEELFDSVSSLNKDEFSAPIKYQGRWFIFYIYQKIPLQDHPEYADFFRKQILASPYRISLDDELDRYLEQKWPTQGYPEFKKLMTSYPKYQKLKNLQTPLYEIKGEIFRVKDIQSALKNFKNLENIDQNQWKYLIKNKIIHDRYEIYRKNFFSLDENKKDLATAMTELRSEWVLGNYLPNYLKDNPQLLSAYYQQHLDQFRTGPRADLRMAVVMDSSLIPEVKAKINSPDWEDFAQSKKGVFNTQNQAVLTYEDSRAPQAADLFRLYQLPFQPGTYTMKLNGREVVIWIKSILPAGILEQTEIENDLREAVLSNQLEQIIKQQEQHTPLKENGDFIQKLYQNFKK